MLPADKLDLIYRRHEEVSARLAGGATGAEFVALSRELAELDPVASAIRDWRVAQADLAGVEAMLADPAIDGEMREMAEEEKISAQERIAALEQSLKIALLPKDAAD